MICRKRYQNLLLCQFPVGYIGQFIPVHSHHKIHRSFPIHGCQFLLVSIPENNFHIRIFFHKPL